MKYFISFMLLAFFPGCSQMSESNASGGKIADWVIGKWQYTDDKDKSTTVVLYPDGSAIGSDESIGSWYFIDKTVYIVWDTGWQDLIEKNYGSSYKKLGFAPGIATSTTPSNTSDAVKVK
ncbi:MAG: hypothetical protein H0W50_04765 [Parachlamydiaceae bacterium]|nr:hypothetical protein [Parachlamydiaceae bacterium]